MGCEGRAFWMGYLREGTKVVRGRNQRGLGRNEHEKIKGKGLMAGRQVLVSVCVWPCLR